MRRYKSRDHARAARHARGDRSSFAAGSPYIDIDWRPLTKALGNVSFKKRNQLLYRGLNKGIAKTNTAYHKHISRVTAIRIKTRLKRGVRLSRAGSSKLEARYTITDRSIRATKRYFGASYRNYHRAGGLARQGRSFSPKGASHAAGGIRRTYRGSFMLKGRAPAFIRLSGSSKAMVPLWGHNPAKVLRNDAAWAGRKLTAIAREVVVPEVHRLHDREMKRVKRKYGL